MPRRSSEMVLARWSRIGLGMTLVAIGSLSAAACRKTPTPTTGEPTTQEPTTPLPPVCDESACVPRGECEEAACSDITGTCERKVRPSGTPCGDPSQFGTQGGCVTYRGSCDGKSVSCGYTAYDCVYGFKAGCSQCRACWPGTRYCSGDVAYVCDANGDKYEAQICSSCDGGTCDQTCDSLAPTSLGCEFYAVTHSNPAIDPAQFAFAVAVANPSASEAAVTITGGGLPSAYSTTVPPKQVKVLELPWVGELASSTATQVVKGGAYFIRANHPVAVFQLNPAPKLNADAGSTDYSLLLPANALGDSYRVATHPAFDSLPSGIAVVGVAPTTMITVSASPGALVPDGGIESSGGTVTLDGGDVLQLASPPGPVNGYGIDLSGTLITASAPVQVFGTHGGVPIPANGLSLDHLEEVQLPLAALRTEYVVTVPFNSNGVPHSVVKLIGTQDGTSLSFDPPISGAPVMINAGQAAAFSASEPFHLAASAPVAMAQFLESGSRFSSSDAETAGDPSMTTLVPTEQYLSSYVFYAPPVYAQNWADVVGRRGIIVKIDGVMVEGFVAVGDSGYVAAKHPLCAGTDPGCTGYHEAIGTGAFGLQLYGYARATSYAFPAGLSTKH